MTAKPASTRRKTTTADARPKGRSKAEQRAETQEQILNEAEFLFSKHGLHGVTLKDVAKRVGVHTTLMHYYFADKKALFDAVMERRAPVTSGRRMAAMDAYEASVGGKVTVEGALHAYLDTDLDSYIAGGEPWRNYAALGAQVANTPEWGSEIMNRLMDPVVKRLIDLLRKAMPDTPDEDIFWGYHFVSGALMMTLARTGRIDKLSDGLCRSEDFEAVKARMAKFMAGGFHAICAERAQERRETDHG
ncbi:TetR/AcrR family transcriptional regulator [Brevundimonas lenta]|uniref:AcrR family transcriptional regulator n=1 Tax=Brevundimonas lenta TaxID=424796 RepID=A0A7W6NPC0_9CAUL|nr:TetR/AcrR family transcriptional regulator [Brevundimonas lenta]MBB4081995.1 AcrR family transcriptional regulator [Brevundimonas lenta]